MYECINVSMYQCFNVSMQRQMYVCLLSCNRRRRRRRRVRISNRRGFSSVLGARFISQRGFSSWSWGYRYRRVVMRSAYVGS
jgi:hypothetical protein